MVWYFSTRVMGHLQSLLLALAIILAAAKAGEYFARLIKQPPVFGEILAGLILGPTVLNLLGWRIFSQAPPGLPLSTEATVSQAVFDIASLGVIFLMFLVGIETDLKSVRRVGVPALSTSVGGVAVTLALGTLTVLAFSGLGAGVHAKDAFFIAVLISATSVSIVAETLVELGRLNSKEGSTLIGAAVVDDVIGLLLFSFFVGVIASKGGTEMTVSLPALVTGGRGGVPLLAVATLILLALYVAVGIIAFPQLVKPLMRFVEDKRITGGLLVAAIGICIFFAWGAEFVVGVSGVVGAYFAGVLLGRTEFGKPVQHGLHALAYSLFIPVFFVSVGLHADAKKVFLSGGTLDVLFAIAILIVAIVGKLAGCYFGAKIAGYAKRDAYTVAVGMITRGEVVLIVSTLALSSALIAERTFSVIVLVVLVTTLVTPVWLKAALARRRHDGTGKRRPEPEPTTP
jgi:Kef-type K+ transport system membrane component KefB